ncbi:MAG TPA: hypothetical protein DCS93_29125 [Microscillaceae bacterium]|nr:hypothetical protein [Microscillaceae bacterium]
MRPRKNHPQRQNQNEHRYTDKVFEFWQRFKTEAHETKLAKPTIRSESWLKNQADKIGYADGQTQLVATLELAQPNKEVSDLTTQRALYALIKGMQPVPELAMVVGYLLIVKSTSEEQAQFKIYNLTNAQHKIIINNPLLLQMPFRLEISLGLSEEQTIIFEESEVLKA